ncbi:hypothetical protein KCU85_g3616, partial [Aureobasidium melanogenum]
MSTSNKHNQLHQAISSIKEVCTRTIRPQRSEHQPLLQREVVSTKQDSTSFYSEKPSVNVNEIRKDSAKRSRFEPDFSRELTSEELADMLYREAGFPQMAMRI